MDGDIALINCQNAKPLNGDVIRGDGDLPHFSIQSIQGLWGVSRSHQMNGLVQEEVSVGQG